MNLKNMIVKGTNLGNLTNIENLALESLKDETEVQRYVIPIAILPYEYPVIKDKNIYMLLSSLFPLNIRIFSRDEFIYTDLSRLGGGVVSAGKSLSYRHDIKSKKDCLSLIDVIRDLEENNNSKVEWGDYVYQSQLLQKRFCEGFARMSLDPNDRNLIHKTFKFSEDNGLELYNMRIR